MAGFYNRLIFWNGYILFTVHVVFIGRLVCSVNMLYMELSYTGSLDWSTRASEHVTVQIGTNKVTGMAGFYNCLFFWNYHILFTVHVVFVGSQVCSVNVLYIELSYTGSLDEHQSMSQFRLVYLNCYQDGRFL